MNIDIQRTRDSHKMPNGFDTNDDSLHPNETLIVESQTCVGAQHFQEHTDAVFNWASGPSD